MSAPKSRITLRDIADELGLSTATVSTALTGRRNRIFVSEETCQRVVETAERMGYSLDRLRARHHDLTRIAVFFPVGANTVYHTTALQVCQTLGERDLNVTIHVLHDYRVVFERASRQYHRHEVDGAVMIGSGMYDINSGLPWVMIGEKPEGVQAWQAVVDNADAGRQIGEHLWSLGHRRIGFVRGAHNPMPAMKRLEGLRSVWQANGAEIPTDCILEVYSEEPAELDEKVPGFIGAAESSGRPLTALVFWCDWLAILGIRSLRQAGLRVPDDVSVSGFDDGPMAELTDPPLTTVRVPFADLGTAAAELLEARLQSPEGEPQRRVLPGQLMVRGSTARVDN